MRNDVDHNRTNKILVAVIIALIRGIAGVLTLFVYVHKNRIADSAKAEEA